MVCARSEFWRVVWIGLLLARAEVVWGQLGGRSAASIEAVVAKATVVVRARVHPEANGRWRIEVLDALKGEAEGQTVLLAYQVARPSGHDVGKAEYLVALGPMSERIDGVRVWATPFWPGDSPWRLDGREERAYAMDGGRVSEARELMARVRAAVEHDRQHPRKLKTVELMCRELPNDYSIGRLPVDLLEVPADDRLADLAAGWIGHPSVAVRVYAALTAQEVVTAANVGRFRPLLSDPAYEVRRAKTWEPQVNWRERRHYPVREAAGNLGGFDYWGAVYSTANPTYFPVRWGKWAAALCGGAVLGAMTVRRWRWRWRSHGLAAARWGLGGLALVLAWLAWRSGWECMMLSWAPGDGMNYEMASVGGQVSLLRVEDSVGRQDLVTRTVPIGVGEPHRAWFETMLMPKAEAKWAGFAISQGEIQGDPWAWKYRLYAVPYWAVAGGVGLWPGLVLIGGIDRRVRGWRRRRGGRCVSCGYDLRGGAGRRCSECGGLGIVQVGGIS